MCKLFAHVSAEFLGFRGEDLTRGRENSPISQVPFLSILSQTYTNGVPAACQREREQSDQRQAPKSRMF